MHARFASPWDAPQAPLPWRSLIIGSRRSDLTATEGRDCVRWVTHGRRPVFRSDWVEVWLDDVEIPGHRRLEHHVVRFPRASVTAVVTNDADEVLLLWRHRFITDAWGWEIPAGWAEPGEDLQEAACREVEEETGYRPTQAQHLVTYNALSGISTMRFTAFLVTAADLVARPDDTE
ncbi:MAG: NUDIX domain-containing protein, partial [Nitriliruptorales bacterium]|nr:NUDIX domain-containing protein [Nitriliruptorales bacterium]